MQEATPEIQWLNTGTAAQKLGITTRTLYRFIDEGRLPGYRFGRVIRIKSADLEAFIDSCRIQPGTLTALYIPGVQSSDTGEPDTEEAGGVEAGAAHS